MKRVSNKYRILGLDISTKSTGYGLVVGRKFSKKYTGLIIPDKHFATGKNIGLGESLKLFGESLDVVFKKSKPDMIVIEDTFFGRNVSTLKILCRFSGVALEHAYGYLGVEPTLLSVQTIRRLIQTKNKEDTFEFVCNRYGLDWVFKDKHDCTDAIAAAIAHYNDLEIGRKIVNESEVEGG